MQILEAIILGLIQGLTEFLPISSSGHLLLIPELVEHLGFGLDFSFQDTNFDIVLHIATFVVVAGFYLRRILRLWQEQTSQTARANFVRNLALTALPSLLVGTVLSLTGWDEQSKYVAVFTLVTVGLLLIWVEFWPERNGVLTQLKPKSASLIGLFQALALIRGTSRSGITLIGGLTQGLKRQEAFDYAFIASLPLFAVLTLFEIFKLLLEPHTVKAEPLELLAGFLAALISGFITIHFFRRLIIRPGFLGIMGLYRVLLGLGLLYIFSL